MDISKYIEEMKNIQVSFLNFIDNEEDIQNLIKNFDEIKIHDDLHKINLFLHLLSQISNNHHRESDFFNKIEQIILLFKNDMKNYYTNSEIFNIFQDNKRLLLVLIEDGIMIIDEFIAKQLIKGKYLEFKYPQYFSKEIQKFVNEKWFKTSPKISEDDSKNIGFKSEDDKNNEEEEEKRNKWIEEVKKKLPTDFDEKRKTGENGHYICELIRKDLIDDFIIYINQNSIEIDSEINPSIYETNSFLFKKEKVNLIEYATFFGSIQIFNYLINNGVELSSSLWNYAIHGNNAEIIQILEENEIKPLDITYRDCLIESIKCHHINIFNYIKENYISDDFEKSNEIMLKFLKYYNFCSESNLRIDESLFYDLCQYDYTLVALLLNKMDALHINERRILFL